MSAAKRATMAPWAKRAGAKVPKHPSWLGGASTIDEESSGIYETSAIPRDLPDDGSELEGHPPAGGPPPQMSGGSLGGAGPDLRAAGEEIARLRESNEALAAENDTLRAMLGELTREAATMRQRMIASSEPELVKLAFAIASRAVGDAARIDPALVGTWAREAAALLPGRGSFVVAVATDLASALGEEGMRAAFGDAPVRVDVDPSLPSGRCELREGAAVVEVSAETRLVSIGEAIGAIP